MEDLWVIFGGNSFFKTRNGDTLLSATSNRLWNIITFVYDPETYKFDNLNQLKEILKAKKNYFISFSLLTGPLMFGILYFRHLRIKKAQTNFYLNQMMKRA